MNLRVDLILETEQRSASVLNPKALMRMGLIVVPVIVGAWLAFAIMGGIRLRSELNGLQSQWEVIEQQQKKAKDQINEFRTNSDIKDWLSGLQGSRIDWHAQLTGFLKTVPPNIQVASLAINQNLQIVDNKLARVFALTMKGKTTGPDAEKSVKDLEAAIADSPPFGPLTAEVSVPEYGADTSSKAKKDDRVFTIKCAYTERHIQ